MKIYTVPNVITCIRIAMVFPILFCLFKEKIMLATILFIISAVSDLIDGWIARRFDQQSELGSVIDPFADRLLLNSLFITFGAKGWIPNILWIVVMLRDIILVANSLYIFCISRLFEATPSLYGKTCTLFQVFTIGLVLFEKLNIPLYNKHLLIFCIYMTIILALVSLVDYLTKGIRILKNNRVKM